MWQWPSDNWSLGAILVLMAWWWPWWLFLPFWFVAGLLLPRFYQVIFSAIIFDLIYTVNLAGPWRLAFPLTIASLILIWLASELQYRLRL